MTYYKYSVISTRAIVAYLSFIFLSLRNSLHSDVNEIFWCETETFPHFHETETFEIASRDRDVKTKTTSLSSVADLEGGRGTLSPLANMKKFIEYGSVV